MSIYVSNWKPWSNATMNNFVPYSRPYVGSSTNQVNRKRKLDLRSLRQKTKLDITNCDIKIIRPSHFFFFTPIVFPCAHNPSNSDWTFFTMCLFVTRMPIMFPCSSESMPSVSPRR